MFSNRCFEYVSFSESSFSYEIDANTDMADYPFLFEVNSNAIIQENTTLNTDLNENRNKTGKLKVLLMNIGSMNKIITYKSFINTYYISDCHISYFSA